MSPLDLPPRAAGPAQVSAMLIGAELLVRAAS